jgi:hypothetical protein
MTVSEAFAYFKSELELPDRKACQAAAAQQDIRAQVAKYLDVPDSFLTGSYARHTKISPLNDIDVFLIRNKSRVGLSSDGSGVTAPTALDQVAAAVRNAYGSRARITLQHRSVNVEVQGLPFGFDLIPAWLRHPDGFWIPNSSTGGWLPSDPNAHADLMTTANEASGGKLKPLIKMTKYWSRQNYDLLCSFHIELTCREILAVETLDNWQLGLATILVRLHKYIGRPMLDPIYAQTRVDKELTPEELDRLTSRLGFDADRAVSALKLERAGDDRRALVEWETIFVGGFPHPS